MFANMHKQDVMAELRKRYGAVAAFEKAHGLPAKSVHDLLRGRKSDRVRRAIVQALNLPPKDQSETSDRDYAPVTPA